MMKKEAGARIEEMLCQLADATCIDGEIWRAAYTLEDKIAKNILREWIEDLGLEEAAMNQAPVGLENGADRAATSRENPVPSTAPNQYNPNWIFQIGNGFGIFLIS